VAESATELDLSGIERAELDPSALEASPPTVRPGIKRATLEADRDSGVSGDPAFAKERERSPADYLGYIIDGRYHVQSIIAQGGMGVVYLCRHRTIDKAVAVKILRPDLAGDRDVTERFLIEARAASSVGNRHIIDVTDFGELPDGATYLVMEYLEGHSLAARMKRRPAADVAEIVDIGCQVAQGLHAAHEAGIVHRDLKPDNIFLCAEIGGDHFVKILDFGIAKVASSQNKVTRAGKIFGTPHYMAPEQGAGTAVDRRTDIYSLGVMLYELACGHVPFDAENPLGILTQHMYVAPVPPNERTPVSVPVGLEAIILKCLSKNPDHRYPTMQALQEDLQLVRKGQIPRAVADLLARGTDELPLQRLRNASALAARARRTQGTGLALALSAGMGLLLAAIALFPLDGGLFGTEIVTGSGGLLVPSDAGATGPKVPTYTVALVLSPIDAHVFDGARDLGTMPISIQLRKGETATVEVRRDGFVSQQARIDGSRGKLIVELEPMPGVDLETLVPTGALGATADAGVRIVKLGTAAARPRRAVDAGRPRAPRPPRAPAPATPSPSPVGSAVPTPTTPAPPPPQPSAAPPSVPLAPPASPQADIPPALPE
jgi:serine/threonine-protein kinase